MKARDFLIKKKVITSENSDLQIGFTDGSTENLTQLLEEYFLERFEKPTPITTDIYLIIARVERGELDTDSAVELIKDLL